VVNYPQHVLISGVLIMMPEAVAAFARDFRARYAVRHPSTVVHSVPPHISLMVPFVPPGRVGGPLDTTALNEATARLREVCRSVAPFTVTLDRYGTFPGGVLFLAPRDPEPTKRLYHLIQAAFPEYPAYGGEYAEFVPHMTLDVYGTDEALAGVPRPAFEPFSFGVREVVVAYGDLEVADSWTLHAVVPLGGEPAAGV
jgi:2'-5' RNA ligase